MAYELHIVEDEFDAFRRRIAKAHAEVNLDATSLPTPQPLMTAVPNGSGGSVAAPTAPTAPTTGEAVVNPTRTRRTKAEMEAAKAAAAAPAADAAPATEKAQAPAQAPAVTVTREQVRAVMGEMIARHPLKAAAATQFLATHANGAKNISGTADADLPALHAAIVAWLDENPSDPAA